MPSYILLESGGGYIELENSDGTILLESSVVPAVVTPTNCTNLWDFSGAYRWDFSGYPGWSWDGYESTPLECAVTYFAEVGVNVGQLTYQCSNTGVPLGNVITGYVPFINADYAGEYIPLVISNGPCIAPRMVIVPNVVGMFYYDAQLAILNAALTTAQPTWALSTTVLPQYVISQSIAAGSIVTTQTQVTIVVSGFTVLQQPGIPTPVP